MRELRSALSELDEEELREAAYEPPTDLLILAGMNEELLLQEIVAEINRR
jgi:hypothetical protein